MIMHKFHLYICPGRLIELSGDTQILRHLKTLDEVSKIHAGMCNVGVIGRTTMMLYEENTGTAQDPKNMTSAYSQSYPTEMKDDIVQTSKAPLAHARSNNDTSILSPH